MTSLETENATDKVFRRGRCVLWYSPWIVAIIAAILPLYLWTLIGFKTDQWALRRFTEIRGVQPHPKETVIVGIEGRITEDNKGVFTPRSVIADVLEKIVAGKPKVLILTNSIPVNTADPEADLRIANALAAVPTVIGTGRIYEDGSTTEYVEFGSDPIISAAAKFAIPMLFHSQGNVVSRLSIDPNPQASLYERVPLAQAIPAELISPTMIPPDYRDLINFYGPPGTIKRVAFQEVLDGAAEFAHKHFNEKVVFMGYNSTQPQTSSSIRNSVEFDTHASELPMFGTEIIATIVSNLIDQSWLQRVDTIISAVLIYSFSFLLIHFSLTCTSVSRFASVAFFALIIITAINYFLFSRYQLWISGVVILWLVVPYALFVDVIANNSIPQLICALDSRVKDPLAKRAQNN